MKSRGRRHDEPRTPRVAVIGAGFSGIAAAVALKKRGIEDFVIFESADGIGGTWWKNRYPGAEVDLESHIYSFSFERADWSREVTEMGGHRVARVRLGARERAR